MEIEPANLALEMGDNVMLYLDDIQQTDPEFLQKFISLCDAHRNRGKMAEAIAGYEKIIRLEPDGEAAAAAKVGLIAVENEKK